MHTFATSRNLLALTLLLAGCAPAIGGVLLATSGGSGGGSARPSVAFETATAPVGASAVAAGDLDGDDDLDLIFAEDAPRQLRVYVNSGTRRSPSFAPAGPFLEDVEVLALHLADVDADTDLDLVTIHRGSSSGNVWVNDGSGTFTDSGQAVSVFPSAPNTAAVADVDGDGALDLVTGDNAGFHVWRNDGAGSFTAGPGGAARDVAQVVPADLDQDGDIDLLIVSRVEPLRLWSNDGAGTFTAGAPLDLPWSTTPIMTTADVDRDGDLDLIGSAYDRWYALNEGDGAFGPAWTFARQDYAQASAVGDFDRDGSIDLVDAVEGADFVWLNVGRPSFVLGAQLLFVPPGRSGLAGQVVVVDLNADGRPDIVQAVASGIEDGGSRVFLNTHGQ